MQGLICHPWEVPRLLDGSLTVLVRPASKWLSDTLDSAGALGSFTISPGGLLANTPWIAEIFDCPFPAIGERFYAQEEYRLHDIERLCLLRTIIYGGLIEFRDGTYVSKGYDLHVENKGHYFSDWYNADQMPEERSRCKPEVVSVRVERISQCEHVTFPQWCADYPELKWESNPWIWVAEVKV